jgi:hypothetical protein
VATINGLFHPESSQIREVERLLRENLGEPDIDFIVRFEKSTLYDREGIFRLDLVGLQQLSKEQELTAKKAETMLDEWFKKIPDTSLTAISHAVDEDYFHFLIELSSIRIFSVDEVRELEEFISEQTGQAVRLHVVSKPEVLTSSEGYEPYDAFLKRVHKIMLPEVKSELDKIVLESGL